MQGAMPTARRETVRKFSALCATAELAQQCLREALLSRNVSAVAHKGKIRSQFPDSLTARRGHVFLLSHAKGQTVREFDRVPRLRRFGLRRAPLGSEPQGRRQSSRSAVLFRKVFCLFIADEHDLPARARLSGSRSAVAPSLTLRVGVSHALTRRVSEGSAGNTPRIPGQPHPRVGMAPEMHNGAF
jgi:hypothetical protein